MKEDIIRTLSVPWSNASAARVFVDESRKADDPGLRWALANGLEVVADDDVFAEIAQLVLDAQYGKAREMLAVALGNMTSPAAVDLLMDLLDDEDLVGHAIMGLAKLKPPAARQRLAALTKHHTAWVRAEARRALASIGRAGLH